jgi:hypothetical protein
MAEVRLPTKTITFFDGDNNFRIFTYYDEGGACVNYIITFKILTENTSEGLEGDLIVTIDGSNPSTDVWLQPNGDLFIEDPIGDSYALNLDGDVIFTCE